MRKRMTMNDDELSAARRRASLSRKHFRGGRPKGWRKPAAERVGPVHTTGVDALDYAIFHRYAKSHRTTIKRAIHLFAAAIVMGGEVEAHPDFKPAGWKL